MTQSLLNSACHLSDVLFILFAVKISRSIYDCLMPNLVKTRY